MRWAAWSSPRAPPANTLRGPANLSLREGALTLGEKSSVPARRLRQDGEYFDARTGEPESWSPSADEMLVLAWARLWVSHEWESWSPHSRRTAATDLAWFVALALDPKAPAPPSGIRLYIRDTLDPSVEVDAGDDRERWLATWGLRLGELTRELLADVERQLGIGHRGEPLAAVTSRRRRATSHSCVRRAVELGRLESDPWPPTPKGRARRKSAQATERVDVERLPGPATMTAILQGMLNRHRVSRTYQAMSAVAYYAGLRPGEVVMLRARALTLPATGWGRTRVIEADDGTGEAAMPKTGERWVPISADLVAFLRAWIEANGLGPDDYLFRNTNGRVPEAGTWGTAVHRGCEAAGWPAMRVYDLRHACATNWLGAGVKLGETARRMGHSVEVLVRVYAGALEGDDVDANRRIDAACAGTTSWMASGSG